MYLELNHVVDYVVVNLHLRPGFLENLVTRVVGEQKILKENNIWQ
jgi:hypothetical protein